MDRLEEIKARVKSIIALPLEDREAIPHDRFMEITKEFLSLIKEWKEYANISGNASRND